MNFSDFFPQLDGAIADQLCDDAAWAGIAHVVRVGLEEAEELMDFGQSKAVVPTHVLEVRVSDVPAPAKGDVVVIGTRQFTVLARPRLKADATWWRCEAKEG